MVVSDKKGKGKGTPWVPNLYCKTFLETGKCDSSTCPGPHFDRDEVANLRSLFGEHLEKYFEAMKLAMTKGNGKNKNKKGSGK